MSNEKQDQPPVNPKPSAPAAAGQEEGEWYYNGPCIYALQNYRYVAQAHTLDEARKLVAAHNASLREQLHGEKEPADVIAGVLQKAIEALEPFRQLADKFDVEPYRTNYPDDLQLRDDGIIRFHNFLTLGDCRKAKAVWEILSEQPNDEHCSPPITPTSSASLREKEDKVTCVHGNPQPFLCGYCQEEGGERLAARKEAAQ